MHMSITEIQTSIIFDNNFTGVLLDLVIVGLVSDADHASGYQKNPFNFLNFDVNRIALKRNDMFVPRHSYTLNFANGQYKNDQMTFLEQFDCGSGDKCICLTPSELTTGYTLYAFKITDEPIGVSTLQSAIQVCYKISAFRSVIYCGQIRKYQNGFFCIKC